MRLSDEQVCKKLYSAIVIQAIKDLTSRNDEDLNSAIDFMESSECNAFLGFVGITNSKIKNFDIKNPPDINKIVF